MKTSIKVVLDGALRTVGTYRSVVCSSFSWNLTHGEYREGTRFLLHAQTEKPVAEETGWWQIWIRHEDDYILWGMQEDDISHALFEQAESDILKQFGPVFDKLARQHKRQAFKLWLRLEKVEA